MINWIPKDPIDAMQKARPGKTISEEGWYLMSYQKLIEEVWVQGYLQGEFSLEDMITNVKRSIERLLNCIELPQDAAHNIKNLFLGSAIWDATSMERKKRGRGRPHLARLADFATLVVDMYVEQGFRKDLESEKSAFTQAATFITTETRRPATPQQVYKWYYPSTR